MNFDKGAVMIHTNDRQIVWQPVLNPKTLAVILNREFAGACIVHNKQQDIQNFVEGVWRFMDIGFNPPIASIRRLDMYEGILPKGFYGEGDGLWLTLDHNTISCQDKKRSLAYYGHNDERSVDRLWLLRAFEAWVEAAKFALEWK